MGNRAVIAILALSFLLQSTSALSLAIGGLAHAFPDASVQAIQMAFTLVSLSGFAGTLIAGAAARLAAKKSIVIVFSTTTFLAAMVGYFAHDSLTLLYGVTIAMGFGVGVMSPICTAIIAELFTGEKRAAVNGMQALFMNCGALISNLAGGLLVSHAWQDIYLIYPAFVVVAIICAALLPKGATERRADVGRRRFLTPFVSVLLAQGFLLGLTWMTLMANASFCVLELEGGSVEMAGFITMAQSLGGMAAGLSLMPILKRFGRGCLALAHTLAAAGLWVLFSAGTLPTLILGSFLVGCGYGLFMPAGYTLIPNEVRSSAVTLALSMFLGAITLGGFCNPYLVTTGAQLLGGGVSERFLIAAVAQTANIIVGIVSARISQPPKIAKV